MSPIGRVWSATFAILLLIAHGASAAQRAVLQTSPAPFYVGVPIDLQIIAEGFDESPQPEIKAPAIPSGTLALVGVSPNVSTNVRIINGRMTQWKRVRFVYSYRLNVEQAGALAIGSFTLTQGPNQTVTQPLEMMIEKVPRTGNHRIRLVLPDDVIWIGQRVPVTLEWWVAEATANRVVNRRARVPLFDRIDTFKFDDPPTDQERKTTLTVDSTAGALELRGSLRRETHEGTPFLVVSFSRVMIPLKAGRLHIEPSNIVVEEAIRFSRNLFGDRVPTEVRRARAEDSARELVVKSAPPEGRPRSYSGAVGQGFSIDVKADRTVLRAGDPIRLSIVIRGDTALESVGLPPLAASGLDPSNFRVPSGDVAGVVEDEAKHFTLSVRVLNDRVREIPPIELSWFDPVRGQYDTTRSRPVALSVDRAQVVSATDVVRDQAGQPPEAQPESETRTATANSTPRAAFSLRDADLAVVADQSRLLEATGPWLARPWAQALTYAIGLTVIVLAVLARRRALQDPEAKRSGQARTDLRARIASTTNAGELAGALRLLAHEVSASALSSSIHSELDAVLQACDEIAFAPDRTRDANDPALQQRALVLADAMLGAAR